jgi:hypothetical protein
MTDSLKLLFEYKRQGLEVIGLTCTDDENTVLVMLKDSKGQYGDLQDVKNINEIFYNKFAISKPRNQVCVIPNFPIIINEEEFTEKERRFRIIRQNQRMILENKKMMKELFVKNSRLQEQINVIRERYFGNIDYEDQLREKNEDELLEMLETHNKKVLDKKFEDTLKQFKKSIEKD